MKIEENSENVSIDLHQEPAAFPEPSSFMWYKDGLPLTDFEQTYSNVTFDFIGRMNTGNYTVFSSNFVLGGSMERVGNDTGSFYLDVLCKFINSETCMHTAPLLKLGLVKYPSCNVIII